MYKLILFLFVIFAGSNLLPQVAINYKNYTDMKNTNSVYAVGDDIWAATSGGAFLYNASADSFFMLTKTDGLTGSVITATAVDNRGKVWFGGSDGTINVYNPQTDVITPVLDIFNSERTQKQINELYVSGDTIYVSTAFGLSLVNTNSLFFYDTFSKFGTLTSNISVNSSLNAGLLYAATQNGIAVQKPGTTNLLAPESWNIYQAADGISFSNVFKIISFNNSVIASTDKGIFYYNGAVWQSYISGFDNIPVKDLTAYNDTLFILTQNIIYKYFNGNFEQILVGTFNINKLAYSASLGLLAVSQNGIYVYNEERFIQPNGPAANQFPDMTVDHLGRLWSASGKDNFGKGFYRLENGIWQTFNVSNTPQLLFNDYVIASSFNEKVYIGSWGRGFAEVRDNGIVIYNADNTSIKGIPSDPQFLVVTGIDRDSRGNLWVLNHWPADARALSMLTPDSTWYHFSVPAEQNRVLDKHFNLAIDPYDTKWYNTEDPGRTGLFYFNENKTYDDPSDDKSGYLTTTNGLNSNTIRAVAVDKRGDVWIGTSLGVNIITNNSTVLSQQQQLRILSVFTLRQQSINCIAVDPLNRKWVGTNQGLLLVNPDGTSLIAALDSKNSPLLSDIISSIAIDERSGKVYVGTDAGLTSFETLAVEPVESFTEIFAYPNPFILNGNSSLTIDGLIRESDIKILNISGKLITEFSSPGGRLAIWDGKDLQGNYVSSGVYIIVAFDKEGNSVTTGKIAVLKK